MKSCLIFAGIFILLAGCVDSPSIPYQIGVVGPSGGIIFYDDEADGIDDIPGYRYLEAAPEDYTNGATTGFMFGFYKDPNSDEPIAVSGTDTAIGTGAQNTTVLVQTMGNQAYPGATWGDPASVTGEPSSIYAAKLCADYSLNGFDDWFLPSQKELEEMYEQLYLQNLGSFTEGSNYWSSSEVNRENGYITNFTASPQSTQASKGSTTVRMRPVRMF